MTAHVSEDELETNEDPINKEISKRYYQDYDSLTDDQKLKSGTKEEHDARRTEYGFTGVNSKTDTRPRMAGQALRQLKKAEERNETGIANAENAVFGGGLENFDSTAYGAGMGKGTARLSKADIKGLRKQGVGKQEILDYVEANPDVNSSGGKAQKLLNKFKTSLAEDGQTPNGETPDQEDNPPAPDVPEDTTLPVDTGNPPPTNDTPAPPEGSSGPETPPIIDSRYWQGDEHTSQMLKNISRYNETTREGQNYHMNKLNDHLDMVRSKYSLGDPNTIMGNTLDWVGGMAQKARDRALIYETKLWGDVDNMRPPEPPTERYDDSVPESTLGDIADDFKDDLKDM